MRGAPNGRWRGQKGEKSKRKRSTKPSTEERLWNVQPAAAQASISAPQVASSSFNVTQSIVCTPPPPANNSVSPVL